MSENKPFRALFWADLQPSPRPVFPLRSFAGLAVTLVFVILIAVSLEFALSRLSPTDWTLENQKINLENKNKLHSSLHDPVMRGLGFSVPEVAPERRRILIIGDSFIWGDGLININMTWWRQMQWELEKRGYHDVDVIAAGVPGASTQDQLGWLKAKRYELTLVDIYKPSAIIIGYVTNDPQIRDENRNNIVSVLSPSRGTTRDRYMFARRFPNLSNAIMSRFLHKVEATRKYTDATGYPYAQWELKLLEGKNYDLYKHVLADLSRVVKTYGSIPFFFVSTPNRGEKEYYLQRLEPVKRDIALAGMKFYDLLPDILTEIDSDDALYANPANGHPGPRMTHFYAQKIADILENEYPDVLGNKSADAGDFPAKINDWMPAKLEVLQSARAEWLLQYPSNSAKLFFLPVGAPHAIVSFERPVSIAELVLSSVKDTRYTVWGTALDAKDEFELSDSILLGNGRGETVTIRPPRNVSLKRITSLRIAADRLGGGGC
jgi:lysophospholipase L1-like esterase